MCQMNRGEFEFEYFLDVLRNGQSSYPTYPLLTLILNSIILKEMEGMVINLQRGAAVLILNVKLAMIVNRNYQTEL